MRTYHITLSGRVGYKTMFKATSEFVKMRGCILRFYAHHIKPVFVERLVNTCDIIRDLKVGESLFVILAPFAVYTASSLEGMNGRIASWEKFALETHGKKSSDGNNYMPIPCSAFVVRRTQKRWDLSCLDYNVDGQISDL